MSNRIDHTLALVVVVLMHVVVVTLAIRVTPTARLEPALEDAALDVTWIQRRASRAREVLVEPRARSSVMRRSAQPTLRPTDVSRKPAAASQSTPDTPARSDASAGTDPPIQGRLDLRLPEPAMRFEPTPLARRGPAIEAYQDRMTLRFSDRSFGGKMQRMTKRSICGDLRSALNSGEGTDGVLEAMREHGCAI